MPEPTARQRRFRRAVAWRCMLCAAAVTVWQHSAMAQRVPDAGSILKEVAPSERTPLPPPAEPGTLPQPAPSPAPPRERGTTFTLQGITLTGNAYFSTERLSELWAEKLGTTVGLDDLDAIAARITSLYRQEGFVLAQVVIPAQDVTSGTVQMTVLEGVIGNVHMIVSPNAPIRPELVQARLARIEPGKPLMQRDLERTMLTLSDLPGIRVSSTLEAGSTPGTVDLLVQVEPERRWDFTVIGDNYGTREAGELRMGVLGRINSPFMIGDNLDVRALVAQAADTAYGRVGYDAPIGNDGLRAGVGVSQLFYSLGREFEALGAHGNAAVVDASLTYPLVRTRTQNLIVRAGMEFRDLRDKISAIDSNSRKTLIQGGVGMSYEGRDAWLGGGFNSAGLDLYVANLDIRTQPQEAIDQGPFGRHTEGTGLRVAFFATRLNTVTARSSVFLGITGQLASKNQDSSSRIALGGPRAVRAYSAAEALVDEGMVATAEYRYAVTPAFTVFGFYDFGAGRFNAKSVPGQGDNTITRSGAGIGMFFAGPWGFTMRGTLAWRTSGADTTGNDRVPRLFLEISKAF